MIPCSTIHMPNFQPYLAECTNQNSYKNFGLISIFGNKKSSQNVGFISDLTVFETFENRSVLASTNTHTFTDIDLPTQTDAETL